MAIRGSGNEASCIPNYGCGIEMYRHARASVAHEKRALVFVAVAGLEEMERW
jgi:hypothetical protein